MVFPTQIQFRGMANSVFVSNAVWDHVEKLAGFFDRILSCHVVISAPHRHHRRGKIYHVTIRLGLPGGNISISTEPEKNLSHQDVYVGIRDAFNALRRQLEDFTLKRRGFVKSHHVAP